MRLVFISDTHTRHRGLSVPDGDVLIHAGDMTRKGDLGDLIAFNTWLGELPHPHKLVVAGNHDWCWANNRAGCERALSNATYLEDAAIEIGGLRFYGTPWQPDFHNWAFNLPRGQPLREKWQLIPPGTDVLITHGPPRGILDRTHLHALAGCDDLREIVAQLGPRIHVFGHIHEAYGEQQIGPTTYLNASSVNLQGAPVNPPIVRTLE
jgi:predicted phosphodiesterase